ncbi:MAG: fic family protein [Flavipsychrobacter sp.]|jgi:Fic family protein|nr:fic family protein [Flavipsychrobacter sp.]
MANKLTFISPEYLKPYSVKCHADWLKVSNNLKSRSNYSIEDFDYYIIASSVFSSNIEGNSLDLNSFMNNRGKKTTGKKKEFKEIEDLAKAYGFAAEKELTVSNFLAAHKILSETLLIAKERGKYRKNPVGVFDNSTGRPVYLAVEPENIKEEVRKLFGDISILLDQKLSYKETFYYASMIHLWIAFIHPFADGNGRIARLLEKWFLVKKLGAAVWSIYSEKYYWDNRAAYYKNISLGYNYYTLKWERCIPFLLMLPESLEG